MSERILTPQQELFLASYTDPQSTTFSNAKQSALKAGYSEEYSDNITGLMPDWLSENIGNIDRLKKAERNLDYFLDFDTENTGVTKKGDTFSFNDPRLEKIKADVSIFLAETMGKKKYSKKSPLTDDNNQPITVKLIQYPDGSNTAI